MGNLRLDDLILVLGTPEKQVGNEVFWQCPYCKDKSKNNLMYNLAKGVLWCFADDTHAPNILRDIFRNNKNYTIKRAMPINTAKNDKTPSADKIKTLSTYIDKCNHELLNSPKNLGFLFCRRGIGKYTVEFCKLGLDKANNRWVFPSYKYSCDNINELYGIEYRPLNLNSKGIYREAGMQTCMAMINNYDADKKALMLVEGYLDGYAMVEYLSKIGQLQYYHIITPSNGVHNVVKLFSEITYAFNNYQKIFAYLDSDKAGIQKMEQIKKQYPFVATKIMNCGCKDFNEHYLKCLMPAL